MDFLKMRWHRAVGRRKLNENGISEATHWKGSEIGAGELGSDREMTGLEGSEKIGRVVVGERVKAVVVDDVAKLAEGGGALERSHPGIELKSLS
jgi:hypothetical protein